MSDPRIVTLAVERLTPDAFAPFGILLSQPGNPPEFIGNASHSWLMPFDADGGPQLLYSRYYYQPVRFSALERHFNVTQGFVPLGRTPLVMVVAPLTAASGPAAVPAPDTLRAFYMDGTAGLVMHKGTWHTLDRYPVRPPHVDCVFLTGQTTQLELMREKSEGIVPTLTEVVDYKILADTSFEVVGLEEFAAAAC